MNDQLIYVGVISDAYHLKGLIKITSFAQKPEDICKLACIDKDGQRINLSFVKLDKKKVICRITGIDDRTAAEKMIGTKLYAMRSSLPITEEDEHYIEDLVGLGVVDHSKIKIGVITGAFNFGAGDILEVRFLDGKYEMFGFTKTNFPEVAKDYVMLVTSSSAMSSLT